MSGNLPESSDERFQVGNRQRIASQPYHGDHGGCVFGEQVADNGRMRQGPFASSFKCLRSDLRPRDEGDQARTAPAHVKDTEHRFDAADLSGLFDDLAKDGYRLNREQFFAIDHHKQIVVVGSKIAVELLQLVKIRAAASNDVSRFVFVPNANCTNQPQPRKQPTASDAYRRNRRTSSFTPTGRSFATSARHQSCSNLPSASAAN